MYLYFKPDNTVVTAKLDSTVGGADVFLDH